MEEIKITVTIDEANLILEGLGLLPFAKVYGLVAKIQEQASGRALDRRIGCSWQWRPRSRPAA